MYFICIKLLLNVEYLQLEKYNFYWLHLCL